MRVPVSTVLLSLLLAATLGCDPAKPLDTGSLDTGAEDADGDGYGAGEDCDDSDPAVNPGAEEVCNARDDDCDGEVDEGVTSTWYADADGDGYGDPDGGAEACEAGDGYVADASDCDDGDAAIHPDADEACDGLDNDCDGEIDEDDAADAATWYADADGDGFGDPDNSVAACDAPSGFVAADGDCDDADAAINPDADEVCDGLDNDCDGEIDEDDAVDAATWYADGDGDGYGDADSTQVACEAPSGFVADNSDCDDSNAAINESADEVCDGIDNDCNGTADEDALDAVTWYADADGDGYGDADSTQDACTAPSGYVSDATDCDDGDDSINPGATELCGGVDEDCDGVVDEDDAADAPTWYADSDGDGYGDASSTTAACSVPSGYVGDDTDCDDGDATVNPGATELCNGIDDDCDGTVDEDDAADASTWYADSDGDGYGDASSTTAACSVPSGYVADDTDCDDGDAAVSPAGAELCNGIDDDCDGTVDEDDAADASTWYADSDGDGYGDASSTTAACSVPSGYVADDTDCDDGDATINPAASEAWYDGVDSDCDGDEEPDPCGGLPGESTVSWDADAEAVYPDPSTWSVSVEWSSASIGYSAGSSYNQVMMTPVVGQLTDDNGDGMIDAQDTPDVAFTTYSGSGYASYGYLRVFSGDGSGEHLSVYSVSDGSSTWTINGSGGVALGDLDADGLPEIVTIANGGYVLALEHDGSFKWASSSYSGSQYMYPSLHDMDDDGYAEVIAGGLVLDHTGVTLFDTGTRVSITSFAADMDQDGVLDLVHGSSVYDLSGALLSSSSLSSLHSAVADFDGDGVPELLGHYASQLALLDNAGATLWSDSYSGMGYGAQCVADFDGDGLPEVGVPGAYTFTMVDDDGSTLWTASSYDPANGTMGCSAFDFDGDGQAEVVYGDRTQLFVWDGATGSQLWYESSMASGSLYEFVYVADVDGDGDAEIVIGANNYSISGWTGIVVLGEDNDAWASARPVWNQHAWYGDHVTDDGAITHEGSPWLEHNDFRTQHAAGALPGAAPDLELYLLGGCEDCSAGGVELSVAVDNTGSVMVPAGVSVALYADDGGSLTLLDVQTTSDPAWPGDRLAPITFAVTGAEVGSTGLVAVVDDDGTGAGVHTESDETDNSVSWVGSSCP